MIAIILSVRGSSDGRKRHCGLQASGQVNVVLASQTASAPLPGAKPGRPRKDHVDLPGQGPVGVRDYLLSLAIEWFGRSGFHVMGVAELLKGTGISKPVLYRFFGSKEGLIVACVEADCRRVATNVESAASFETGDGESRVRAMARILSREALDDQRRGFFATSAVLEFPDPRGRICKAVLEGIALISGRLSAALEPASGERAPQLAQRMLLLAQGAGTSRFCVGPDQAGVCLESASVEVARALLGDSGAEKKQNGSTS